MCVVVLSDVHSNLPALEAVLSHAPDAPILCCGDLVGYYCWPNEVIETLRARELTAVRGNHDDVLARGDLAGYPAQEWTQDALTDDTRSFLQGLPYSRRDELDDTDVYVTHGSPRAPLEEYVYPEEVNARFFTEQAMKTLPDVLLLGHTHVPFAKQVGETLVVNPGSVGQPRDGDQRAAYAVLDLAERTATHHRVPYDIDRVADRVRAEGFPDRLADRLYGGR